MAGSATIAESANAQICEYRLIHIVGFIFNLLSCRPLLNVPEPP
jgi:hypothetical protein